MRKLRTSLVLSGIALLLPLAASAQQQEPVAEDVTLEPQQPAAEPPAPVQPAPVAQADTSAGVSFDTSAGADSNANANANANAAAPLPSAAQTETGRSYGGPVAEAEDEWKFGFAGYLRAPMRFGIGKRDNKKVDATGLAADPSATGTPIRTTKDQSQTTLHSPMVPDDQYLSWQHTSHSAREWAELFFSYGNSWASGTVSVQGYNFTDSAFNNPDAQFGIAQGYVTIKPYMPWENVRFTLKGGNFWSRYGMAGKYDAGEYDTFLFGRTHTMGETARVEVDFGDYTLGLEQGLGTKRHDPSMYDTTRFTMLHHEHADLAFNGPISFEFGLHFLSSWTQSENPEVQPVAGHLTDAGPVNLGDGYPDGSLNVFGADGRFDFGRFGYLYAGFSRVQAKYALTVGPAIEVIHSYGGGEYDIGIVGNYLNGYECRFNSNPQDPQCSNGNGAVNTVLGQYEFSVTSLAESSLFGEGRDLSGKLYGMFNQVESDDPDADGMTRLKFGADLEFDLFPVLAVGLRADHLKPNSNYASQDFSIISPRIMFRSSWVTHEQISIRYSRYLYSQRTCANSTPADIDDQATDVLCVQPASGAVTPDGFGAHTQNQEPGNRGAPSYVPDENVVAIEASMWW